MLLAALLALLLNDPLSILLYAAFLSAAISVAGGYGGKFWASYTMRREVRRLAGELEIIRGNFEDRIHAIDIRVKRREGEAGQAAKGPNTPRLPKELPEGDPQAKAELEEILGKRGKRPVRAAPEPRDEFPTFAEGQAALASVLPE